MSLSVIRQGDVGLVLSDGATPKGKLKVVPREGGRLILAHGEITGHAHVIDDEAAVLYVDERGELFLSLSRDTILKHEEHTHLSVPKQSGLINVKRQREYSPEAIKPVQD